MEYKIFRFIRHNVKIPLFIRFIFGVFFIFISSLPIVLPLFPWSLFAWVVILVFWILLIVPWSKIRHVVKIRKWIIYMIKNFHKKKTLDHKMKDISDHIKEILKDKRNIKK